MAEVDGDAGLLLQFSGGGVGGGAVGNVLAGLLEGGLCEGDHLVVGDGRVVAHSERARGRAGEAAAEVADMVRADSKGGGEEAGAVQRCSVVVGRWPLGLAA